MTAQLRWILSACAIVGLSGGALIGGDTSADVVAKKWIVDHQDALPRTMEELRTIPSPYRQRVAKALAPDVLSRLWQEQLSSVLVSHELTGDQRAAVERLRQLATPGNYSSSAKPNPGPSVCQEIDASFPRTSEVRKFLYALAPDQEGVVLPNQKNWRLVAFDYLQRIHGHFALLACDCAQGSQCGECRSPFGGNEYGLCPCGPVLCDFDKWGCGCGMIWACNGMCSGEDEEAE